MGLDNQQMKDKKAVSGSGMVACNPGRGA